MRLEEVTQPPKVTKTSVHSQDWIPCLLPEDILLSTLSCSDGSAVALGAGVEPLSLVLGGEWLGSLAVESRHCITRYFFLSLSTFALLPVVCFWGCDWRGLSNVDSSQ